MEKDRITVMVFSDIHYTGIMPDAVKRLEVILAAAKREKADCIICLGDTAWSKPEFQDIGSLWNGMDIPHYMILGNHDLDRSSKEEAVAFYGLPSSYYSFDAGNLHFAALDTNFWQRPDSGDGVMQDYNHGDYAGRITNCFPDRETEWLERDLKGTDKPVVLLSHAPLCKNQDEEHYCKQYRQLHDMLLGHNERAGKKQVFLSCHGHSHVDSYFNWDGIHHLGINSASNVWLGPECERLKPDKTFPAELHEDYECLRYVAPYKEAVYAVITFDITRRLFHVKERISEFIGKTPVERGHSGYVCGAPAAPGTQKRELYF